MKTIEFAEFPNELNVGQSVRVIFEPQHQFLVVGAVTVKYFDHDFSVTEDEFARATNPSAEFVMGSDNIIIGTELISPTLCNHRPCVSPLEAEIAFLISALVFTMWLLLIDE